MAICPQNQKKMSVEKSKFVIYTPKGHDDDIRPIHMAVSWGGGGGGGGFHGK